MNFDKKKYVKIQLNLLILDAVFQKKFIGREDPLADCTSSANKFDHFMIIIQSNHFLSPILIFFIMVSHFCH